MKDSGVEWIGEIPDEWEVSYVKHHMKWKSEKGQPNAMVLSLYRDYGVIPKDSRDDNHNVTSLDTASYKVVSVGDFVINKMKAWQGSMAVSDYQGIVSPAYHVCEITDKTINKKYLHYLLRNSSYLPEYLRLSTGMRVGQWDLGFEDFKNIPVILPPVDEQARIVECIDCKCDAIDSVIKKTKASIEEYKKLKQAVITQAVTKGVRGERPMKDSGIEWAGKIPNSWYVNKINRIGRTSSGATPLRSKETDFFEEANIRWIRTLDLNDWLVEDSSDKITELALNSSSCSIMPVGTVCVAMYGGAGTIGKCGMMMKESTTNQAICSIVCDDSIILPKYLLFQLLALKSYWMIYAVGTRKDPNISQDIVGKMKIIIPDIIEQKEIIDYLEEKCRKIDTLISKKEQFLTELENYKKSLIYEYVTGKKEVL
jgi:type I restriction enzyme S subunit